MKFNVLRLLTWVWAAGLLVAAGQAAMLTPDATDKTTAQQMATSQGKFIFLVAGRSDCGNCIEFESNTLPNSGVSNVLHEAFIYWSCALDAGCNSVTPYVSDMGGTFPLPTICIIDPADINHYKKRWFGYFVASTFQDYLRQMLIRTETPMFVSPSTNTAKVVISSSASTVSGATKYVNVPLTGVYYKLNGSGWLNKAAAGNTWSVPLSGVASYLVQGTNSSNKLYVYGRDKDGYGTQTNVLTFAYDPTAPPSQPVISGLVTNNSGQTVAGVTLSATTTGGAVTTTATTDANGSYALTVPSGWIGLVTPSKADFVFIPPSISYAAGVTADQVNQSYRGLAKPVISASPVSLTVTSGVGTATFTVAATGFELQYQWQRNGADIPGAVGSSYTVPGASWSSGDTYAAVVGNAAGSVTSATAMLTVLVPAGVSTPPAGLTVLVGQQASFAVVPSGTPPFGYKWQFKAAGGGTFVDLPNGAVATYVIAGAQPADAGEYRVIVSNSAGSITSSAATLIVNPAQPPVITSQPVPQSWRSTTNFTFSVNAQASTAISYQWYKQTSQGAASISGANSSSYVLASTANAAADCAAAYYCEVSTTGGKAESALAGLFYQPSEAGYHYFGIPVYAPFGTKCVLEYKTDLQGSSYTPVKTNIVTTTPQVLVDDTVPNFNQATVVNRYYRVRIVE